MPPQRLDAGSKPRSPPCWSRRRLAGKLLCHRPGAQHSRRLSVRAPPCGELFSGRAGAWSTTKRRSSWPWCLGTKRCRRRKLGSHSTASPGCTRRGSTVGGCSPTRRSNLRCSQSRAARDPTCRVPRRQQSSACGRRSGRAVRCRRRTARRHARRPSAGTAGSLMSRPPASRRVTSGANIRPPSGTKPTNASRSPVKSAGAKRAKLLTISVPSA